MPAATYFDASGSSDDLSLLPKRFRADQDLPELADVVTADIVAQFSLSTYDGPAYAWQATNQGVVLAEGPLAGLVKLDDYLYVALRGYAEDPTAADPRFREAMRREIADVLLWRIQQSKRGLGLESEGDGETSKTYRDTADHPFPPHFPRHLRPFIVEPVTWSF